MLCWYKVKFWTLDHQFELCIALSLIIGIAGSMLWKDYNRKDYVSFPIAPQVSKVINRTNLIPPVSPPKEVVRPSYTPPVCSDLVSEVKKYNWDHTIMIAIAKAESGCRYNAKGDTKLTYQSNGRIYGYSVGFFQIRILPGREHCDSYDVATNVRCAYAIYKSQGKRAWSVYTNGKYRAYL